MKLSDQEKQRLLNKYGSWALVTGASSGIGRELATLLALAGFNLILNGRDAKRLDEAASTLPSFSGISIKTVAADVSVSEGIQRVIHATYDLPVGLVIISAGFGTSGHFIHNQLDDEMNMLRVNGEALLTLTHHFSRRFAEQKRGGIILMSSIVAFQGVPNASHYAATKAYVQSLAEGITAELKPFGVDVLAAAPGPVRSGFEKIANMTMNMALTPDQVGVPILKALGRKTTVFPGLLTKILVYSLATVPRWAKVLIMGKVMVGMTRKTV